MGAQCRSAGLAKFYMMIGSALDELGRGKEAIETYNAAIKMNPELGLLHYNLAISLRRAGKQAEARSAVQRALSRDPNHNNSHALLASMYQESGYRVPAILAYSRLLVLEPESPRAGAVLNALNGLIGQGVQKGKEANSINILLSAPSKSQKDEGDFMGAEMMLSIVLAADLMEKPASAPKKPSSAFEKVASVYSSLGESLDNSKPKGGFAAAYYAPYFAALVKAGHAEAFAAHTWKAANLDGAAEWRQGNEEKMAAFLAWSKAYAWPAR